MDAISLRDIALLIVTDLSFWTLRYEDVKLYSASPSFPQLPPFASPRPSQVVELEEPPMVGSG